MCAAVGRYYGSKYTKLRWLKRYATEKQELSQHMKHVKFEESDESE